ncbi:MAG: right-handed parallel beta-helix repeat-containing protein, partial [Roseburia sp.]|nr:right-handed parallel beta-helix repeat-containing protein [Roseburia sp.]
VRARSEGSLTNAEFLYDDDGNNIGLICDDTELLDYENPDGLEFVYSGYWSQSRAGVSEIQAGDDGRVWLIMDQPCWDSANISATSLNFAVSKIDYYENALALLDEPGEWYLDEVANKLYYMPRSFEDMSIVNVTIPVLDAWDEDGDGENGLLMIAGSDYDNVVQNIRFEGITFADTTYMRPSSTYGHNANQNNHIREEGVGDYDESADAAITVKRSNSVTFVDCEFTRIGTIALKVTDGAKNTIIDGNRFYDISGNAIQVGEPDFTRNINNYNPSDLRKMTKNCDITNNYIHDIGVEFQSSSAIGVGFVPDVDISHNEIFNIPYCGIHVGLGWGIKFTNVLKNMTISYNFIHDLMHESVADGGAIYTNGNTAGNNVIYGNYLRNQGGRVATLYFDNGTTDWTAYNNVADTSETLTDRFNGTEIYWAYTSSTTKRVTLSDNYSVAAPWIFGEDIVVEDNTEVPDLAWPTEALTIINTSGLESGYTGLRNNQAERISSNLSDVENLALKMNETFQVSVAATDGKDNAVTLGDTVYYGIDDEEVATVSEEGLVTARKAGKTVLRVYVLSNHVLDVIETELYVDDQLSEVALEDISGDIIMYAVSGSAICLQAYGLTDLGRKVELTDVSYKVADADIAIVSEDGILEALAAGETTVTVTGTADGQTKSATYNVIVNYAGKVSYLDEFFDADNQEYWIGSEMSASPVTTWECVDGVSITTELNGFRNYTGTKYGDELMTFYLGIERQNTWPSIYIRTQEADNAVGLGATGYIICFTDKGMQLQRFNGSTRSAVIYGTVTGFEYIVAPNVTPYALEDGELHKIQVGAINEDGGVRLLMYIDGEMIFNYLDTDDNAIKEDGYFGLIGTSKNGKADKFTLVKALDTEALENSVDAAEAVAESGYTEESLKALHTALTAANALLEKLEEDPTQVTQDQVDAAAEALEKAIAGLTKKTIEIVASATDGTYTLKSMKMVTITCTGDFEGFISVYMDGKEVAVANYDVKEGSTILTLKPAFLETLAVGNHTVVLNYTLERKVETTLKVEAAKTSEAPTTPTMPSVEGTVVGNGADHTTSGTGVTNAENVAATGSANTGDTNAVTLWLAGILIAIMAIAGAFVHVRKTRRNHA